MDETAKKTALRMIPYGLYVLTAEDAAGQAAAATVNWVTQCSFAPPLVALGVKADSGVHALVKRTEHFALNILGRGQESLASAFFKPTTKEGMALSQQPYRRGATGSPILEAARAHLECKLVTTVERGDHSLFVGEVVAASARLPFEGRPDAHVLTLAALGEKVFYGG